MNSRLAALLSFLLPIAVAIAVLVAFSMFAGCANTTFYRDGRRIARLEGDMRGMALRLGADGSIEWSAAEVSHSAATAAQGKAATDKITAIGAAVAASGVLSLFR